MPANNLAKYGIEKAKKLAGKRILLRLDLNTPLTAEGEIGDPFRLLASLPTIKFLIKEKAKVIIVSHLGSDGRKSLAPIAEYLGKYFKVTYFPDLDDLTGLSELKDGQVAILENIRRRDGEMENKPDTAKWLAGLADIYVNDAFAVSHRSQASTVGVVKYLPSFLGPLFLKEYENLSKAFTAPKPFLFILGGAKFQTKIPLLKTYTKKADKIFIGGALANSFLKKLGYEIGESLADSDLSGMTVFLKSKNLLLPNDVVVNLDGTTRNCLVDQVKIREVVVDIGSESVNELKKQIASAKFILWNGPLGNFEKGYDWSTVETAKAIAKSKAFSILGGGDTISAIAKLKLEKKFSFVSTAGGAMLDFLAQGTLPVIEAIKKSKK